MWADGWRKSSKKESFGRYCSVGKLLKMMRRSNYNPEDKATAIKQASDFISIQLQHLAPGVFESYRQVLIDNNLSSMSQMEYPLPYDALILPLSSPSQFTTFTRDPTATRMPTIGLLFAGFLSSTHAKPQTMTPFWPTKGLICWEVNSRLGTFRFAWT